MNGTTAFIAEPFYGCTLHDKRLNSCLSSPDLQIKRKCTIPRTIHGVPSGDTNSLRHQVLSTQIQNRPRKKKHKNQDVEQLKAPQGVMGLYSVGKQGNWHALVRFTLGFFGEQVVFFFFYSSSESMMSPYCQIPRRWVRACSSNSRIFPRMGLRILEKGTRAKPLRSNSPLMSVEVAGSPRTT